MATTEEGFDIQETIPVTPEKRAKKKKKGRGLIALLIVFLIVIVLPVATVFGLFYDSTRNQINVDPNVEISEMFNKTLVNSLDNTTDPGDERVELVITQDDLNQVLYAVTDSLDGYAKKLVPQIDIKINGEKYDFYINLNLSFFKTRIIIKTLITEDEDNNAFVFQIKDIAIARLQGLASFTASIISMFLTDDNIESMFGDFLNLSVSLKDRTITYPVTDLINDLKNLAGMGGSNQLYFSLIQELVDKEVITFDFDDRIQTKLSLTQLMTNDHVDGGYNLNLTSIFDAAAADTKTKIEAGTLDANDSTAIKTNFDDYVDANVTIPPSDSPGEIMLDNLVDFSSYTPPQIVDFKNGVDPTLTYITEPELNGFLANIDFVGTSFLVTSYDGEDAKVQYIVIDNLFSNFISNAEGDFIYFGVGLNVNGTETYVVFATEYDSGAEPVYGSISMKFVTRQIFFGEVLTFDSSVTTISESEGELIAALFEMLSDALSGIETMSINEDDFSINFSFTFDSVVQSAIDIIEAIPPTGSAVPAFEADANIDSSTGKLKVVWQND